MNTSKQQTLTRRYKMTTANNAFKVYEKNENYIVVLLQNRDDSGFNNSVNIECKDSIHKDNICNSLLQAGFEDLTNI